MKKLFLLIVLLAGFTALHSQESSRKGFHLGAHFTPGYGTILTEAYDYLSYDFGMTAGIDVNYYFTDLLGIHTGVTFLNQPWKYEYVNTRGDGKDVSATLNAIGIPARFLLTTGHSTVGFYLEAGIAVYFPISYTSDLDLELLETSTAMFSTELVVGININVSEAVNLNVGAFSNTTFPVFSNIDYSYGLLNGIKLGFMYKLGN